MKFCLSVILFLFVCLKPLYSAEPLDKVVAIVNDSVITEQELSEKVMMARQQIKQKNMQMPEDRILRKQVLDQLISMDLQMQLAKANNIQIDDTELDTAIENVAKGNKMTMTEFRSALASQGMSWKEYRQSLRKEMMLHHLQQKTIAKDIVVTNEQVEDFLKSSADAEKSEAIYHIENIVISLPEEPTADQLQEGKNKAQQVYLASRKNNNLQSLALAESNDRWLLQHHDLGERHLAELPEVFSKEVVNMKAGDIHGPIRTGNGFQLIKLIEIKGKEQKHIVMKTHARHILIKQNAGTTIAEAEKRVNNLYQQMQSGKDFAQLAKKYSVDTASAIKGGDLGWISPGETVPPFEEAMNQLKLNEVSKPVKTPFGWHLIQVLDRKKVDDSDSWKKQQVRQFLFQRKLAEALQTWQQHLRNEAYIQIMDKDLK